MDNLSILSELKEHTKKAHQNIENNPLTKGIITQTISKIDYTHLLEKFYGYYMQIEKKINNIDGWGNFDFNIKERTTKNEWLNQDLLALGKTTEYIKNIPICQEIPTINNMEEAIGVLYVVEGSTLGGQIQKKFLYQNLLVDETNGAKFFAAYGKDSVGFMWKKFQDLLVSYDGKFFENRSKIIKNAENTFETLDNWLKM